MKLYFYNESGEVFQTVESMMEVDPSRVVAAKEPPEYSPKSGFHGRLFVEDGRLVWHFVPVDANAELTGEQVSQIFNEIM